MFLNTNCNSQFAFYCKHVRLSRIINFTLVQVKTYNLGRCPGCFLGICKHGSFVDERHKSRADSLTALKRWLLSSSVQHRKVAQKYKNIKSKLKCKGQRVVRFAFHGGRCTSVHYSAAFC